VSSRTSEIKKAFKVAGGKAGCITHITEQLARKKTSSYFSKFLQ
jgi:hypothetical protein